MSIFNNLKILKSSTIREALIQIQDNKKRLLVCYDDSEKIVGVLSEGDIRRALICGLTVNNSIVEIINEKFEYLDLESNFSDMCNKFRQERIDFLPILDNDMKLINIITKKQFHVILLENIKFDLKYDFFSIDESLLEHEINNRPWGFYKSTILTSHAQSKIIIVFPNSELSLQEHKKREEHWVIIKGNGLAILGESKINIYPGKYIYIPKGCKHQIINNSSEDIIFSEVQLGEYFGEDDIIRYKDKYNRTWKNKSKYVRYLNANEGKNV